LNISIPQDWYQLEQSDIHRNGGRSLLMHYHNNSSSQFIQSQQPEHSWFPWKFKYAPRGTWKKKENQRLFFQYLTHKLNIQKPQDWYSLKQSTVVAFGGFSLLDTYYNNSPIQFLKAMMPNHTWHPWKFKRGFWRCISTHISYFEWMCKKMNITHPEMLYALSYQSLIDLQAGQLLHHYGDSPGEFVMKMNVELEWIEWMFKGAKKWEDVRNREKFFWWISERLGVKKNKDWYLILSKNAFSQYGGSALLRGYYGDSPFAFLKAMIPNHNWIVWKFTITPMNYWKRLESHIDYFEWLREELELKTPETLYSLSQQHIIQNYGSGLVVLYGGSVVAVVRRLMPEMKWEEWMFKGNHKWENVENHKRFFNWLGEELGFHSPFDWMQLTVGDVEKLNGGPLLFRYYNSSIRQFLSAHLEGMEVIEGEEKKWEVQDWIWRNLTILLPSEKLQT